MTVRVRDLTRRHDWPSGESVTALDGVSLDLDDEELVALVGDPGAGKSTLLAVLAGAKRATAGTVEVAGVALHDLDDEGRRAFLADRVAAVVTGPGDSTAGEPPDAVALVVADDPTFGLERGEREAMVDYLVSLRGPGRVVVVATHHPSVAAAADRVVVLKGGRIA